MSTVELRREIKKVIDRLPPERLAALTEVEALIPGELRSLGTPDDTTLLPPPIGSIQSDWLTPELLRREASTLISGKAIPQ